MQTSKHVSNKDDELIASDNDEQENEIQDNPSRPSGIKELRTSVEPLTIQNLDLEDTVNVMERALTQ